jgi:eukaryotic-like serine/threonine-protein kinase
VISHGAVAAMGGVAGALSRHADVVIAGMTAADRPIARGILLRLVSAMGTRARRGAHELEIHASARRVLDALVTGRLLVIHDDEQEPTYELAHDCLLTGWPTLRHWLDADTAGRATRERLRADASEWVRLGRPTDATLVWQGTRLDEALALDPKSLNDNDRAFVSASKRVARRRRWQRGMIAASAVLLVVLAYSTQRYLAQRELVAAVDAELAQAREAFDDAQRAARSHQTHQQQAFAAFDAKRWDDGERVWRQARDQAGAAETAYRRATFHVERAFAKDPTRGDVRDLIGDISFDRALLAERVHDLHQRDDQIARLVLYDADGSRRGRWTTPARVLINAPAGATVTVEPGGHRASGTVALALSQGSYVATVAAPGRVPTRAPFFADRGNGLAIDIDPPRLADVPPGFIYIPRGAFLFGNASEDDRNSFFSTTPLRRRITDAYLISRTEVTFGDWLAFLESLPDGQRDARLPGVPSRVSGGLAITREAPGRWRIELQPEATRYTAGSDALFIYPGRARQAVNDWWPGWDLPLGYPRRSQQAVQDWRRFPVVGVSGDDASAYAAWLARTGRVAGARLCSEVEWERAARGADDRAYPGGRALGPDDANVDATHGFGMMGPDEVGSHPGSRSPFGLDDMSGNAFEWTISELGGYILRSGSYQHDRKTAHLTNRSSMNEMVRDAALGFRLCATPPLPRETPTARQ